VPVRRGVIIAKQGESTDDDETEDDWPHHHPPVPNAEKKPPPRDWYQRDRNQRWTERVLHPGRPRQT